MPGLGARAEESYSLVEYYWTNVAKEINFVSNSFEHQCKYIYPIARIRTNHESVSEYGVTVVISLLPFV